MENLKEKFQKEEQEILKNNDFGFSTKKKENKLKKGRLVGKILNVVASIIFIWGMFFPKPYMYLIITCISFPILALLMIKFWMKLEKNCTFMSTSYPIEIPCLILFIRTKYLIIEDYSKIWFPAILISVIFTLIYIVGNNELLLKKGKGLVRILFFMIFTFAYGYGVVVTTNCVFDKSKPKIFSTTIVEKQINGRKNKSYDLYISPWDKEIEITKVSIDSDMYSHLHIGDKVSIHQFKGKFDIPWHEIDYVK